jgi:hypothetical protein
MKKIIAALSIVISTTAFADEILIHGVSYHGKRTYTEQSRELPYNERNLGITYFSDSGWGAGIYKNSYAKTAVHVSYRHLFNDNFGVFVGAATGYSNHGSGVIGGLIARTPSYYGWRIVGMGQPFTHKRRILTLSLSKEF